MEMTVSYGHDHAASALAALGDYVLVAGDRAWRLCGGGLPTPVERFAPPNLEQTWLDTLVAHVPDLPLVGLGGGTALDAAKYCAARRRASLVLVPTLTSSTAPFTEFVTVRVGGSARGVRVATTPRTVVVDTDLLTRADPRLNRAGLGDLVALGTTLEDWQDAAARGVVALDEELASELADLVDAAVAAASLVREAAAPGLELLMRLFDTSARILDRHPEAPTPAGSEHLFAWVAESVTGREFIHGELVALGVAITEHLSRSTRYRRMFDEAGVPWRPEDVGIRWSEVDLTLGLVRAYNDEVRHFNAVLPRADWSPDALDLLHTGLAGSLHD